MTEWAEELLHTAFRMKTFLLQTIKELTSLPTDQLLAERYEKFRKIGVYLEGDDATSNGSETPEQGSD